MKLFLTGTILLLSTIIILITAFGPIIISVITGNWWFCFLFLIVWIPLTIEVTILKGIMELLDL